MTLVEHRAVTPDGKVLRTAVMPDSARWMPEELSLDWPGPYAGEYSYETRVLPGGQWAPAAVVVQPGRAPVIVTRWTLLQPILPAVQAGKTALVQMRAALADGTPLEGPAVASFFRPGKDPEHDLADREPDLEVALAFDPVTRLHHAQVSTAGWAPGTWTVRGRTDGDQPRGWAFSRFPLEA